MTNKQTAENIQFVYMQPEPFTLSSVDILANNTVLMLPF